MNYKLYFIQYLSFKKKHYLRGIDMMILACILAQAQKEKLPVEISHESLVKFNSIEHFLFYIVTQILKKDSLRSIKVYEGATFNIFSQTVTQLGDVNLQIIYYRQYFFSFLLNE